MAVKIGSGDDNPATDSCCVADKVVCGISASLFGMDFLSAGQCGVGNGGTFVSDAAVAGDRSTSNADRRICDFYDTAGGWRSGGRQNERSDFERTKRFVYRAIPHNSKCRYGERGAADAKPKAQIILDVLSSILATQMPCRSRRSGA